MSKLNPLNVATPLVAVTVAVPDITAPLGLLASASVIGFTALAMMLPTESTTDTCTEVDSDTPDATADGPTLNASADAGPATTSNDTLVADVRPPPDAVAVRV